MSESIHRIRKTSPDASRGRSSRTRRPRKHQLSRRIPTKIRSKSTKIFNRSFSEPNLHQNIAVNDDDDRRCSTPVIDLPAEEPEQIVYLSKIRSEVFASAPSLSGFSSPSSSSSPINQQVYKREAAKVVINVSVEGSPGPIRTLVKLSCNVEETIRMVVDKYCKEGRTPKLDKDLAFELHQSHFSIQCLEKTEVIGEIGSRSFYMRKREPENRIPVGRSIPSSNLIGSFIAQTIGRIVRRTKKIWNILRDRARRRKQNVATRRRMGDLLDWIISFLFLVTLLIIVIYQLTCFADLEADHINPYDSSTKINRVVLPEFGLQALLCVYYVFTGHWFMAVLSLPYLFYNIRLFMKKEHLADVTEMYNINKWEQKKRIYKIGHIALSIFITSYWLIHSALGDI
ncbi:unnamed protein product [Microthlaspi erraticum]|uniref:DUF7054 domain-containing protein n=1 Tax=Microthlaspi erraticum TaxID=1685480 RepID=A0A6D2HX87_9BRAS|nr:unnamed protein product [Microthlaspi erraticum]